MNVRNFLCVVSEMIITQCHNNHYDYGTMIGLKFLKSKSFVFQYNRELMRVDSLIGNTNRSNSTEVLVHNAFESVVFGVHRHSLPNFLWIHGK